MSFGVDFRSVEDVDICIVHASVVARGEQDDRLTFDTDQEADIPDGIFGNIGRDVSHEGEILDQSARFSFGRIGRTKHTPLRGLQSSWTGNLSRLFELRRDSCHHSEGADEGESREDVGDSSSLHLESLEGPVPCRDRSDESLGDSVAMKLELLDRVKLGRSVLLFEDLVDVGLEIVVEFLEQILEEQRE